MRNKIGLGICTAGFIGFCIFGTGLDSPAGGWKIALIGVIISVLVFAVGYLMIDLNEVLNEAGLTKTKDIKAVAERKARNRERTWAAWCATVDWRH